MQITKMLVPENKYSIKCPYEMDPEFIVVHNTANDASAENEVAYMIRNDNKVSFHYAVDDNKVVQGIPENRNSWNAGDGANGKGNRKGIAVEICYSKSGGERFEKAEKLASEFIAMKLKEKGWGIDRVKKHQDFANKNCPHKTLELGWDRFLNMVKFHLEPVQPQTTKSIVDLANEVIAGKYGVGEERKQVLGSLYNEVQAKVNEIMGVKKSSIPTYTYLSNETYKGSSIVDALNQINVDSSFAYRKKLAQKNNVRDYTGTAQQNRQLLDKLKAGKLIKA